jgi:hypothetical protein
MHFLSRKKCEKMPILNENVHLNSEDSLVTSGGGENQLKKVKVTQMLI